MRRDPNLLLEEAHRDGDRRRATGTPPRWERLVTVAILVVVVAWVVIVVMHRSTTSAPAPH